MLEMSAEAIRAHMKLLPELYARLIAEDLRRDPPQTWAELAERAWAQ
jgi:hypothetical protein